MRQAVLEFDEEVLAPWRPALRSVADSRPARPRPVTPVRPLRAIPCSPPVRPAVPPRRAVPPRSVDPRPPAGLRLTARAHTLLAALLVALGLALGSWLGSALSDGGGGLRLAGVDSVVVQPGDTLWSVARSAAGDADVRDVVARIRQLNGLTSVDLRPGQSLRLP